ncbi:methyltransferase domain-containing protein [Microvenator marinus]|uniref:Methyltransferase domain-containing protein n=2 Tax=Microvenator marinus TaxID=2600177 RepID=A0A5B8Y045_9DELT|nr:methyltransferase domain-containing protein [Microvenator marinus]
MRQARHKLVLSKRHRLRKPLCSTHQMPHHSCQQRNSTAHSAIQTLKDSGMPMDNETYYDEFAEWYEKERHDGYHAFIDRLETNLILPHAAEKDVLEVGCGTGLILQRVAAVARRAVGMDLSAGMLEHAEKRGLEVVKADATDLPFDDESFDLVYSFKVLAHVKDIDKSLAEMARVTRPGGRLILEFYNRLSLRYLAKRLAGPGKISQNTDEGAVFTRWDSPSDLIARLPSNLKLVERYGVRVLTPAAKLHRIPLIAPVLQHAETKAAHNGVLKHFGGFLVLELQKT